MFKGFKQFLLRGNVVELAVAVVMGAAFGAVVAAFVKDLLTPLIAAIFGKPSLMLERNPHRPPALRALHATCELAFPRVPLCTFVSFVLILFGAARTLTSNRATARQPQPISICVSISKGWAEQANFGSGRPAWQASRATFGL